MATRRQERIALRTRFQKVYDTDEPTTQVAVIGTGPVHYRTPQGEWDEMANLVKSVAGGWVAETDEVRAGIENGWLTFTYLGRSILMRPTMLGMVDASAPATRWRKLADASYADVTREGGTVTAHDIFANTDLTVGIAEGVLTKAFTIRVKPTPPDPTSLGWNPATTYVVIVWDTQKPDGAVIRDAETGEVVAAGYAGTNALRVETATGDLVTMFDAGEAVSANGRKGPVWYVSLGPQVPFGEAVPYARMMATSYPFVIDPTARITTPAASGGAIGWDDFSPYAMTAWSPSYAVAGNDYAYDPGNGKEIPPSEGGGKLRGFVRWDLSALSGTCQSAKVRGHVVHQHVDDRYYLDRVADWYPLTTADWDTGVESLGWSGIKTATYAQSSTYTVAHSTLTGTWVRTDGGGHVFRSTDGGVTWAYQTSITAPTYMLCINGVFIGSPNSGLLSTSTDDGVTWAARSGTTAPASQSAVWTGTRIVVGVGNSANGLQTSTNGATWNYVSRATMGLDAGGDWVHVAWDGTYLWAVGANGTKIRRTTDASGASGWEAAAVPNDSGLENPGLTDFVAFTVARRIAVHGGTVYLAGNATWSYWDDYDELWYTPPDMYCLWTWNGSAWVRAVGGFYAFGGAEDAGIWSDGTNLRIDYGSNIVRYGISSVTVTDGLGTNGWGVRGKIGSDGAGVMITPASSGNWLYQGRLRSTDYGATWTLMTDGDPFTLPAADVQGKFGGILAARFRSTIETTQGVTASFGEFVFLEIEYTEGGPNNYTSSPAGSLGFAGSLDAVRIAAPVPSLKAVLTKVV
jgi:hypothetical protein